MKETTQFEPQMVHVPAGEFLMGTSEQDVQWLLENTDWAAGFKKEGRFDHEQPAYQVTLSEYWIGRYPVTNAEYAAFVQATGYSPPHHWGGDEYPAELSDHPVVYVSWDDAVAYCQWLSEVTGKPYRLPTEAEWEKAARGGLPSPSKGEGPGVRVRIYPWGDEFDPQKCNTDESGQGNFTPVAQYSPAGDSPYGAADMAGNVWEWTSSLWGEAFLEPSFGYPYNRDDGREDMKAQGLRVLRGSSWVSGQDYARCAFRFRQSPDYRYYSIGFRVAASLGSP